MNRKKNLLVDRGHDCRASEISFTSDVEPVLRRRKKTYMESARACAVFHE